MKKQKGFASVELLLVVIVLAIIAVLGVYVWHNKSTNSNTRGASSTHTGAWAVYTSTHSTLRFTYPANWQLVRNAIPNNSPILEDVSLKSPNNFTLSFSLEKSHVNPGAQCVLDYYGPTVRLNSTYTIASVLNNADRSQINSLALVPTSNGTNEGGSGCAPDLSGNPIGSNMDFTFEAWYAETAKDYGVIPKAANIYFNLPEVQTTKTIFGSVQK